MLFADGYFGRGLGIGLSPSGRPLAAYEYGGRSPASKQREGVFYPPARNVLQARTVDIEPLDKSTARDPNRFYSAVAIDSETGLLVVSNGNHTDDIFDMYKDLMEHDKAPVLRRLQEILHDKGPEDDAPNYTPRIAGVITNFHGTDVFHLGIVSPVARGKRGPWVSKAVRRKPQTGEMYCLSTYNGRSDENGRPLPFDIENFGQNIPRMVVAETTAEELAKEFLQAFDRSLVAGTIGLVYHGEAIPDGEWHIWRENRYVMESGNWVERWQ